MKNNFLKRSIVSSLIIVCILATVSIGIFSKPKPAQAWGDAMIAATWTALRDFLYSTSLGIFKSMYVEVLRDARLRYILGRSEVSPVPASWKEYSEDVGVEAVRQFTGALTGEVLGESYDPCNIPIADIAAAIELAEMPPTPQRPVIPPCDAWETWKRVEAGEPLTLDDFVRISRPQNNVFGVYLMASDQARTEKDKAIIEGRSELIANKGYVGIKEKVEKDGKETTVIKTPGSTLFSWVEAQDIAPFEQFNEASSWGEALKLAPAVAVDMAFGGLSERLFEEAMKKWYETKK